MMRMHEANLKPNKGHRALVHLEALYWEPMGFTSSKV